MQKPRSKYYKPGGPTSKESGECSFDGWPPCPKTVFRKGLCQTHFKQVQRRGERGASTLTPIAEYLSPEERAITAGSLLLEAAEEGGELLEYRRGRWLREILRWMESLGWRSPRQARPRGADQQYEQSVIFSGVLVLETSAEDDQLYARRRARWLRVEIPRWMASLGWRAPIRASRR